MSIKRVLAIGLAILGVALTTINLFGLTQNIRVPSFDDKYLRFNNDQPLPLNTTLSKLERTPSETEIEYASRATLAVAEGIAHIEWFDFPAEQFNQIIPIWENYFLYFMGKTSGIPEFERYHYTNYKRSLKRGIGVCGDTSMILSQILDEQDIKNKILTFPGHVVVVASFTDGTEYILDADFGVIVPYASSELSLNSQNIANLYLNEGYTQADFTFFNNMYQQDFIPWNGVQHFVTKKYYFEMIAYWLKWPLPLGMIVIAWLGLAPQRAAFKK